MGTNFYCKHIPTEEEYKEINGEELDVNVDLVKE